MPAPSSRVNCGPYAFMTQAFGFPVVVSESDPVKTVEAREAAIKTVTDAFFNSHLGETRNLEEFASTMAENLKFFSISDKEAAITFKDDKAAFLDGMQKFHFGNVLEVRNKLITPLQADIRTYLSDESLIELLVHDSLYTCKVECEQYRLGKGIGESGAGWYKIEAIVFFAIGDCEGSGDAKLHMQIKNIVQVDYLKTKLPVDDVVPAGAIKV